MGIRNDVFASLLTFPDVIVTGHRAFFTAEVPAAVAATTIQNLFRFEQQGVPRHSVSVERLA